MADKLSLKWIDGNDLVVVPGTTTSVHISGYTESPTFNVDNPTMWLPLSVLSGLASGYCERRAVLNDKFVIASGTTVSWLAGTTVTRDQLAENCMNNMAAGKPITSLFYSDTDAYMTGIGSAAASNYMTTMDAAITELVSGGASVYVNGVGTSYASTGLTAFSGLAASARATANSQTDPVSSISLPISGGGSDLKHVMANALPVEWAKERKWMLDELKYTSSVKLPELENSGTLEYLSHTLTEPTGKNVTFGGISATFSSASSTASSLTDDMIQSCFICTTLDQFFVDSVTSIAPSAWLTSNVGSNYDVQTPSSEVVVTYSSGGSANTITTNAVTVVLSRTNPYEPYQSGCRILSAYGMSGYVASDLYALTSGFSGTHPVSIYLGRPGANLDMEFYYSYTDSDSEVVANGSKMYSDHIQILSTSAGTFDRFEDQDSTSTYAWSSGNTTVWTLYEDPEVYSGGSTSATSDYRFTYTNSALTAGSQAITFTSGDNTYGVGDLIISSGATAYITSGWIPRAIIEPGGSLVFGASGRIDDCCVLTSGALSGVIENNHQIINSVTYSDNTSDFIVSHNVGSETHFNFMGCWNYINQDAILTPGIQNRLYGNVTGGVTFNKDSYDAFVVPSGHTVTFSNFGPGEAYNQGYFRPVSGGDTLVESGGTLYIRATNQGSDSTIAFGSMRIMPGGVVSVYASNNYSGGVGNVEIENLTVLSGGKFYATLAGSGECYIPDLVNVHSGGSMVVDWNTILTDGADQYYSGGGGTLITEPGSFIQIKSGGVVQATPAAIMKYKDEHESPFETEFDRFGTFAVTKPSGESLVRGWNVINVNFNIPLNNGWYAGLLCSRAAGVDIPPISQVAEPLYVGMYINNGTPADIYDGFSIRTFKGALGVTNNYERFYVRQFPTQAEIDQATSSATTT